MGIEDTLGSMFNTALQLPVAYGGMYNNAYAPMYGYGQSQGSNMAQLGGQSMGLYGNLAGQQASMYQSELPMRMEMAKYNSMMPVLQGLLSQYGLGGMAGSFQPISMEFNRPDVMGGYQGAVNGAYSNARAYDGWMQSQQQQHMAQLPRMPDPGGPGRVRSQPQNWAYDRQGGRGG